MKRLLSVIIVLLLLAPIGLRAQLDPVSLAFRAYQAKDLGKAKELIETAVGMQPYDVQARTWYFKAYIYKDLYKEDRNAAGAQNFRDVAINSYFKTIELDDVKEFSEDSKQSVRFLANTYYNDAAAALELDNFENADKLYNEYRNYSIKLNPEIDFRARDIEFKLYVASKYSFIFDAADMNSKPKDVSDKIVQLYKQVLGIDSNNISANYNLGIHYYNQGVNIIENIDYNDDFEKIMQLQIDVVELFNSALPYMLRAHLLDPSRKDSIRGLSGIYYGLNNLEKSEEYQKKLEELELREQQGQ
ncbi:MAG: hypothetical protein NWS74_06910 [Salibacteraceae bacterium]|jgi:hypothetical protein|nr:hypothetical protein [Salibacteraceae bacterium]MDP4687271.1 hypothetical protein [Salibacteraceae bacterium]MDP4762975.1 hypothetical protein [Salibacteraceae bacterium]MDP4844366.1 hypothetical protein [Salibacteraceae bacterium]